MFSSLSSFLWSSSEKPAEEAKDDGALLDSREIEDDWVLVEEIKGGISPHGSTLKQGKRSENEAGGSVLPTLSEVYEPGGSGNRQHVGTLPTGAGPPTKNERSLKDKSSSDIIFTEAKDDSDCSMKTDNGSDLSEKNSFQRLFGQTRTDEDGGDGNGGSSSQYVLVSDPLVNLAKNRHRKKQRVYNRSYSADCYRDTSGNMNIIEPTVLRRRHVTKSSKRSGEAAAIMEVGQGANQKRIRHPTEGTSGVGWGDETRKRTRRANSVASIQTDSHGRKKKRTPDKFRGRGGQRNC